MWLQDRDAEEDIEATAAGVNIVEVLVLARLYFMRELGIKE